MTGERCPKCDREYATSYPSWQSSDTTCGMSPEWNEEGGHEDCVNECLYAAVARLTKERDAMAEKASRAEQESAAACGRMREQKSQLRARLALAEAVIDAARDIRDYHGQVTRETFDEALAAFDSASAERGTTSAPSTPTPAETPPE